MGDGFEADPAGIAAASSRFGIAGDDLGQALAQLRSTLAGLRDYCGSDEQGRAFAAAYDPKAAEAPAAVERAAEAVRSFGPALTRTAERYRTSDSGVRDALDGTGR